MGDLPDVAAESVRQLYADFAEADRDGGSSNDIVQMLDDWFTDNGFPTVLYRERPKRGRR